MASKPVKTFTYEWEGVDKRGSVTRGEIVGENQAMVKAQLRKQGFNPKKVKRAVDLSMEKYCSVTKMLEKTATITADFSIIED